jgi:FimV-like protein
LRENLARTEEELINQQQQNSYLEERIRELESELESAGQGQVADANLAKLEDRLRDERQAELQQEQDSGPWYSRLSLWLIGLLVVVAAVAGWLLSRRGQKGEDPLRSIQSEAEDVLRVLADDTAPESAAPARADKPAARIKSEDEEEPESAPEQTRPAGKRVASEDDAELLDEESSDPEIQLDLARAYISMGDREAARVILEEVIGNGTEEQQAEARKMLELL